jgi:hypothetical protein
MGRSPHRREAFNQRLSGEPARLREVRPDPCLGLGGKVAQREELRRGKPRAAE